MAILLSGILLLAICTPAVAQEAGAVAQNSSWLSQNLTWLSHMAMTAGGAGLAMLWAYEAFGRREVNVADVPTFPKYMTNPQQYRLGSLIFVVFASAFFLLLVYRHKEVVAVAKVFGEGLGNDIIAAVEADAAPYLLVVAAMASVYLYCLKKEADWNVLLRMRDAIHSWISIPQLAGEIVAQIRFSMNVPAGAVTEVVRSSPELVEQDFHKDRATPDRIWAETCYMKWWLARQQDAGGRHHPHARMEGRRSHRASRCGRAGQDHQRASQQALSGHRMLSGLQERFEQSVARGGQELRHRAQKPCRHRKPDAILDRVHHRVDGFGLPGRLCLRYRL
jgi:hypothetical protein